MTPGRDALTGPKLSGLAADPKSEVAFPLFGTSSTQWNSPVMGGTTSGGSTVTDRLT